MPDLSVVAVAYYSGPQLGECLASIAAQSDGLDVEFIVVDNGSDDGCIHAAEQAVPQLRVVGDGVNRGFGSGVNAGFALAGAPWILVVNPDTRLEQGSLTTLVAAAARYPSAAVIGPRVVRPDGWPELGRLRFPSVWRGLAEALHIHRLPGAWRVRRLRDIGHSIRSLDAYDHPAPADWLAGSVLLFRAEAIGEIGGFDESFFLYWEETDWCRRAHGAGWDVMFVPAVTFLHRGGTARDGDALFATYVASAVHYFAKHASPAKAAWLRRVMAFNFRLRLLLARVRPEVVGADDAARLRVGLQQLLGKADIALTAASPRSGRPLRAADEVMS